MADTRLIKLELLLMSTSPRRVFNARCRMHGQSTKCTTGILFYLAIGSVSNQVVQSGNCLLSGNFAQLFKSVDCSNDYLTGLIFQQGNEQVGGARVVAVPQPIDEAKASLKGHCEDIFQDRF